MRRQRGCCLRQDYLMPLTTRARAGVCARTRAASLVHLADWFRNRIRECHNSFSSRSPGNLSIPPPPLHHVSLLSPPPLQPTSSLSLLGQTFRPPLTPCPLRSLSLHLPPSLVSALPSLLMKWLSASLFFSFLSFSSSNQFFFSPPTTSV